MQPPLPVRGTGRGLGLWLSPLKGLGRLHFFLYRLKAAARLRLPSFDAITRSSLERRSSNALRIAPSSRSWPAFSSAIWRSVEALSAAI